MGIFKRRGRAKAKIVYAEVLEQANHERIAELIATCLDQGIFVTFGPTRREDAISVVYYDGEHRESNYCHSLEEFEAEIDGAVLDLLS